MATSVVPVRPGRAAVAFQAVRPFSLVIAVLPVAVATSALVAVHAARPGVAAVALLVAVLLQAGTNTLNDAEDALTGADDHAMAGQSGPMRSGWITPQGARLLAAACFAAAAVAGLLLVLVIGKPQLLWLGALALLVGWAYTAPPLRLAYRPLGELASGVPMGIGITWGTAAAQADHVPASVWWAAVPLALLTAAVLHANNARDRAHDALVGKRTIATYLPPAGVVWEYRVLMGATVVVVALALATRGLPWPCALALVPGALAVRAAAQATVDTDGRGWTLLLLAAVRLCMLTGVALTVGLLMARVVV